MPIFFDRPWHWILVDEFGPWPQLPPRPQRPPQLPEENQTFVGKVHLLEAYQMENQCITVLEIVLPHLTSLTHLQLSILSSAWYHSSLAPLQALPNLTALYLNVKLFFTLPAMMMPMMVKQMILLPPCCCHWFVFFQ